MKNIILSILTLTLLVSSLLSMPVYATTSASFGTNNYCTVSLSGELTNSKKYKTATVKITTYDLFNKKTSGVINVKLTDGNGRYIGTYKKKSGDTIKLGNDHSSYRIYVSEYNAKKTFLGIFSSSRNFINSGKCATWKVSNNKKCIIR